jgi:hypothetical protein
MVEIGGLKGKGRIVSKKTMRFNYFYMRWNQGRGERLMDFGRCCSIIIDKYCPSWIEGARLGQE